MPKRPRVLLAEDHPEVAKAVCRVLSLDCEVVGTVADASAVLDAVQRLQPEVVVLDLNLSHSNGLEACRQITRAHPQTKVIMFTALNDPDVRQRSFEDGASAFLVQDGGPRRRSALDDPAPVCRLSSRGNRQGWSRLITAAHDLPPRAVTGGQEVLPSCNALRQAAAPIDRRPARCAVVAGERATVLLSGQCGGGSNA